VNQRRCLVLGVNGQDGSYAAEKLLSGGHQVVGVGRQKSSRWVVPQAGFEYRSADLFSIDSVPKVIEACRPDLILYLAAVHGASGFSYEDHWAEAHVVNTIGVHACLEYLRRFRPDGFLAYASSSKAFGAQLAGVISERTPRHSSCIYSTTKNAATDLIDYYRSRHSVGCSTVWTFNHESPRRSSEYFVPKIVDILRSAIKEPSYVSAVGSLDFWCDWGDAAEYMGIVVELALGGANDNFLVGTGRVVWAADAVRDLFARYGLSMDKHVTQRAPHLNDRPACWQIDQSKLRNLLGRVPTRTVQQVFDEILDTSRQIAVQPVGTPS
jgi:GDPmannose 4,6-dehydratase